MHWPVILKALKPHSKLSPDSIGVLQLLTWPNTGPSIQCSSEFHDQCLFLFFLFLSFLFFFFLIDSWWNKSISKCASLALLQPASASNWYLKLSSKCSGVKEQYFLQNVVEWKYKVAETVTWSTSNSMLKYSTWVIVFSYIPSLIMAQLEKCHS